MNCSRATGLGRLADRALPDAACKDRRSEGVAVASVEMPRELEGLAVLVVDGLGQLEQRIADGQPEKVRRPLRRRRSAERALGA
jgi:hypothetical protein